MNQMPLNPRAALAALAPRLLLTCGLAGTSAGCAATDPLYATGRWNPTNVNAANLAAQVAEASDLQHGRHVEGSDALAAAAAVARLRQDRVKKLPDSGLAQISLSPGAASADTAAPGLGGL
nr:hypothetical protein [uncultured Lichenicoccus sp.]